MSEIRQKLNQFNATDGALTAEQRTEVDTLTAEYQDVETRARAAIVTEADEERERAAEGGMPAPATPSCANAWICVTGHSSPATW